MSSRNLVIAAALALVSASALADPGEFSISDLIGEGSTMTREQVVAELGEAQRLGLVPEGEADIPSSTGEQESMIARAGHEAAERVARAPENVG